MGHSADGYQRWRAVRLLAVMGTLVITYGVAHTQITPNATLTAGRTERIAFETITLTDSQFLKGEKTGAMATIWGDLLLPQRLKGRAQGLARNGGQRS